MTPEPPYFLECNSFTSNEPHKVKWGPAGAILPVPDPLPALPGLRQAPLMLLPHQGFIFLPKTSCEVREVEFARALRLGQNTLEPVAFHVPRVKVGGGDPAMFLGG